MLLTELERQTCAGTSKPAGTKNCPWALAVGRKTYFLMIKYFIKEGGGL